MMARYRSWLWVAITLGIFPTAFAQSPLRHDPFARPLLSTTTPGATGGQTAPVDEAAQWTPVLSAVMVAGKNSMVSVDGTIVTLGQEIDGYRLVQVTDQDVVFKRGKKRIVLKVRSANLRQNQERAAP